MKSVVSKEELKTVCNAVEIVLEAASSAPNPEGNNDLPRDTKSDAAQEIGVQTN